MSADSFFARWSKHKNETAPAVASAPAEPARAECCEQAPQPSLPPTAEDVAALTPQSDYTRFLAEGVDENVKRSALKKLFTDPHFNVMDGLDIYIGDYNKFDPIPPEMLAALNHAKGLLDPLSQFEQPILRLFESETPSQQVAADEQSAADENTASTVSAPTEPPVPQLADHDTSLPAQDDDIQTEAISKPHNDHTI
jgi:hypothetical protein